MEKKKNVTISEELFIDLVKYFLADIRWDEDRIRSGLQEKLEARKRESKMGVFGESRYTGELQMVILAYL